MKHLADSRQTGQENVEPVQIEAENGSASRLLTRGRAALNLLLEANHYAQDLARNEWDFAVEIDRLEAAGLNASDLRWLICKGYLDHAREITSFGSPSREYRNAGGLTFARRSCFVLTEPGLVFVSANSLVPTQNGNGLPKPESRIGGNLATIVPRWDRDRQELRLGHVVVKQFKVPAINQETILAAFQEEGWPPRIDDPLPPHPQLDPKRRLHDTINSLNRNQKHPLIRFLGDGSGQGVRWDLADSAKALPGLME